jgi:hypothetical protein
LRRKIDGRSSRHRLIRRHRQRALGRALFIIRKSDDVLVIVAL